MAVLVRGMMVMKGNAFMSESSAAVAVSPESTMTQTEVVEAIREAEQHFKRLYQRFDELNVEVTIKDKRKVFNGPRNLKISANRSYQWAKRAGCDADQARQRAIAATEEAARDLYKQFLIRRLTEILFSSTNQEDVSAALTSDVLEYIDKLHDEYGKPKAVKQPKPKKEKKPKPPKKATAKKQHETTEAAATEETVPATEVVETATTEN